MTTIVKNKNVKVEIDTGLSHGSIFSRDELIGMLAVLEADIKAKKKEHAELRQYAVDAGIAQWKLSCGGAKTPKAPSLDWWNDHRKESLDKQLEKTRDTNHPEHSCFWAKPRKTFVLI